jgi:hypothetical protein
MADSVSQAIAETYLSLAHFRLFTLKNVRKSIEFFFKFYQTIQEKEEVRSTEIFSNKNLFIKASFISL